jgi:Activator of Hsp90 ATPase homolog 1-like protein
MATNPESALKFLNIRKEIDIDAPIKVAFAAMLEQLGPENATPYGAMPMKLEAWPGGRWFRDLGNDAGHLWGHVQVIKPPTLLEICGPLFMSYPVASHIQYRLVEQGHGTRLTLLHQAIGSISSDHIQGVEEGWGYIVERIRDRAKAKK